MEAIGFYYFNGLDLKWKRLGAIGIKTETLGDIKESRDKIVDHDGWFRMDGRSFVTAGLSTSQQATAVTLGLTSLPNSTLAVLAQNGQPLASIIGNNEITITQNQLPNIVLSGTATSAGSHSHTSAYGGGLRTIRTRTNSGGYRKPGTEAVTTSSAGEHSHTFTANFNRGGIAQEAVNLLPRAYVVNNFIYLGE